MAYQFNTWLPAALGLGGAVLNWMGQNSANEANKQMAGDQMAFQERMSSTAHQREVKDYEAAGINPILTAGGGGSSSPSGAMIPMQNAVDTDSAVNAARAVMENEVKDAQVENIQAQTNNTKANTDLTKLETVMYLPKMGLSVAKDLFGGLTRKGGMLYKNGKPMGKTYGKTTNGIPIKNLPKESTRFNNKKPDSFYKLNKPSHR